MIKYLAGLFFIFTSFFSARGAVWIVDSPDQGMIATNGSLTLRKAVLDAGINDTIYIMFTGEIRLTTQLEIAKPVRIYGPSPINLVISGVNYSGPDVAILVNTGTTSDSVVIDGIAFRDFNHNERTIHINPSNSVKISNCLFKDNHNVSGAGSLTGGAISNAGVLILQSVSFTNNHANYGGALYSTNLCKVNSCTFQHNNALTNGGGIYSIASTVEVSHGTFYENSAVVEGGGVSVAGTGSGFVFGSMFYFNTAPTGPNLSKTGGGAFASNGYNMLNNASGSTIFGGTDQTTVSIAGFGLNAGGIMVDGYGMEYVPITNGAAMSVNFVAGSTLLADVRKAPRRLSNATGTNYNADCGAFEFTPFVVLNTSSGTGAANSIGWCFNQINLNSINPAYVGFQLPSAGQSIQNTQAFLIQQSNTVMDGFSQPGSRVPGATDYTTPLVNGIVGVVLDGAGGAANGFSINSTANNVQLIGVSIFNRPNSRGIFTNASGTYIAGCHFGTNEVAASPLQNNLEDINIAQGSFHRIGGIRPYERNTFANFGPAAIVATNSGTSDVKIVNNVIGLGGQGLPITGPISNDASYIINITGLQIESNVVANASQGFYLENVSSIRCRRNYFGTNATGLTVVENVSSLVLVNCSDVLIGGAPESRNVFAGDNNVNAFAGLMIDSPLGLHEVSYNIMGLLKDGVTNAGHLLGLEVMNSPTPGTVEIHHNVISGNNVGVNLIGGANYINFYDNIVGLDANGANSSVGNVTGVRIDGSELNNIGLPGRPNYISANTGNGVLIRSNGDNLLIGNYIGVELNQITAAGNGSNGIRIEGTTINNQIGDPSPGNGNVIAFNGNHGISMVTSAIDNQIINNQIFNNSNVGVFIDGGSCIGNQITENSIRDNGGKGISFLNSPNNGIQTPQLIGVTQCGVSTYAAVELYGLTSGNLYLIEVFSIPAGSQDPSGFGEGNVYEYTHSFTAPSNGTAIAQFVLPFMLSVGDYVSVTVTDDVANTSEFSNHMTVVSEPFITGISTDAQCFAGNTGSIDATIIGGSSPFSYEWTDNVGVGIGQPTEDASGLSAGDYYLEVVDATGCGPITNLFTVNEPSELLSTATGTDMTCNGVPNGQLNITINGGTAGYTVNWYDDPGYSSIVFSGAPIFTAYQGTFYPEVVDANGCSHFDTPVTISQPTPISVLLNPTPPLCFGGFDGTIDAGFTGGGTPPYNFDWYDDAGLSSYIGSGSILGLLNAGTYYCRVTDFNGCQEVSNVVLTDPNELIISGIFTTEPTCFGLMDGAIEINVVGGTPIYLYSINGGSTWQTSQIYTGVPAGNYPNVMVEDANGCLASSSTVVSQPDEVTVSNWSVTNVDCNGNITGQIEATGVAGGTAPYEISVNNGSSFSPGTIEFTLAAGGYNAILRDANGCLSVMQGLLISQPPAVGGTVMFITNASCNGSNDGAVFTNSSGGTGTRVTTWYSDPGYIVNIGSGPNISGLSAGTYYWKVTDDNGCEFFSTAVVNEPLPLSLSANVSSNYNGADVSCIGFTDGSIFMSAGGGTGPYDYSIDNGATFVATAVAGAHTENALGAGGYQILAIDANGCTSTNVPVSIVDPPQITLTNGATDVSCFGASDGTVSVSHAGGTGVVNFTWFDNPSLLPPDIGIGSTLGGLAAGPYFVSAQDENGCFVSGVSTVNEPAAVQVPVATSNSSVCQLADIELFASTIGGATYTWSGPNTFTSTQQNPVIGGATFAMAGTYSVVATVGGCTSDPGTVVVNVETVPFFGTSFVNPTVCGAADGSLTVFGLAGSTNFNVTYNDGSVVNLGTITTSALGEYVITGLPAGTYSDITVTAANGCSHTEPGPFSLVDPTSPAAPTAGSNSPLCVGDQLDLTASLIIGATYNWTGPNGFINSSQNPNIVGVSAINAGTYSVTATVAGCTGPAGTVVVSVNPLDDASFTFANFCAGNVNGPINVVTAGGTFGFSAIPSDGATINSLTGEISGSTAGVTYDVEYVTSGTCPSIHFAQVTALAIEDASFTLDDFCEGSSNPAVITGVAGGVFSFNTSPINGETINPVTGAISGGVGGQSYQVLYTTSGTCPGSSVVSVNTFNSPTIGNTLTNPSCWNTNDGQIELSASGTVGPYLFSIDAGASTQPGAATVTYSNLAAGTYDLYIEDNMGCTNVAQVNLLAPSIVEMTNVTTNVSCFGQNDGQIVTTISGGAGPPYQISHNGGGFYATISGMSNEYDLGGIAPGTETIIVLDASGCSSDTVTINITEPSHLQLTASATAADTCTLTTGAALFTLTGGTPPYAYSINAGTPQLNGNFTGLAAGNYLAGGADINGCIATAPLTIAAQNADLSMMINPEVLAASYCPGDPILLSATTGFATYAWQGPNLVGINDPSATSIVPDDSVWFVILVGNGACTGIDSILVVANKADCPFEETVNNAFSPDGDGVNDTWFIQAVVGSPNNVVRIFDRWGSQLREFTNYNNADIVWDGTDASGKILPAGTYYYTIDALDVGRKLSGWVYLINQ